MFVVSSLHSPPCNDVCPVSGWGMWRQSVEFWAMDLCQPRSRSQEMFQSQRHQWLSSPGPATFRPRLVLAAADHWFCWRVFSVRQCFDNLNVFYLCVTYEQMWNFVVQKSVVNVSSSKFDRHRHISSLDFFQPDRELSSHSAHSWFSSWFKASSALMCSEGVTATVTNSIAMEWCKITKWSQPGSGREAVIS